MNLQSYRDFAQQLQRILLPGGLAVILTQEKLLLKAEIDKTASFEHVDSFMVETGGLKPSVFIVKKL